MSLPASWALDEDTTDWEAPVQYPHEEPSEPPFYVWDEDTTSWVEVTA